MATNDSQNTRSDGNAKTPSMLSDRRVWCARAPRVDYQPCEAVAAPELEGGSTRNTALVTLRALLHQAGLDEARYGTAQWNPLGDLVAPGERVLLKPNWVHHENLSGQGMDCLVTHPSVIAAVLAYVLRARPRSIVIGDAPIQGCNFDTLRAACNLDALLQSSTQSTLVTIADFRCVRLPGGRIGGQAAPTERTPDDYVLFDVAEHSDLEAVTSERGQFRVTVYDPAAMQKTHAPGRHQYLIAREAIEADVVINLPKLKTHKKAGVTGALKNLVGINGHKAYLPHHRKGGSAGGGDCYPGASRFKGLAEEMLDVANSSRHAPLKVLLPRAAQVAMIVGREADRNLEGSWHGNDTVWRMCLDLQRILHYGCVDGSLSDRKQRRVLSITDAIIGGQGNGPLAPLQAPLGLMTFGASTAAAEWMNALLLGLDPRLIPLTREAFAAHHYPLVDFSPSEISLEADGNQLCEEELVENYGQPCRPPDGWRGHCEWKREAVGKHEAVGNRR